MQRDMIISDTMRHASITALLFAVCVSAFAQEQEQNKFASRLAAFGNLSVEAEGQAPNGTLLWDKR